MTTPPTTTDHITRETTQLGPRATCRLCGHYGTGTGLWANDDITNWITAHTEHCTPDTVQLRAAGMRDAIHLIRDLAAAGDPALWDHGDGQRAHDAIVDRLQARALELETNVEMATAVESGSAGPRAQDGAQ